MPLAAILQQRSQQGNFIFEPTRTQAIVLSVIRQAMVLGIGIFDFSVLTTVRTGFRGVGLSAGEVTVALADLVARGIVDSSGNSGSLRIRNTLYIQ